MRPGQSAATVHDVNARKLKEIAAKHGARLIVQFGSTVTGKTHACSDIDIGVLLGQREHGRVHEAAAGAERDVPEYARHVQTFVDAAPS
jgi:predicted nucleotidyltransferase